MTGDYRVQIGFSAGKFSEIFTIGTSTLDGTDTLGHELLGGYGGPYDDVTAQATDFKITRGRASKHDKVAAGRMELHVQDPVLPIWGGQMFNPKNALSPIFGQIVPMIPGKLEVEIAGIWYDLFHGWLNEEESNLEIGDRTASFVFFDMLSWLERNWPVVAATGETNTGEAIGLILDSMLFTGPSFRNLQVGDTIPDFSAGGSAKASDLVSKLLEAERGIFFASRSGVATYYDRHNPDRVSSKGQITVTGSSSPGTSADNVRNRARVTREGGVQQEWLDQDSVDRFGYSDWPEVSTPYLNSDTEALGLAKELVRQGKDPISNLWSFETAGVDETTLQLLATLELQDKVELTQAQIGGEYIIENITHTGSGGSWMKTNYVLSDIELIQGFRIGISALDGAEELVY